MSIEVVHLPNGIFMHQFITEIKKYISNTSLCTIFDIGSKDGTDAQCLRYNLGINSDNVYAFEAHPTEYEIHKEKNKDIHWINVAIYEYDGEIEFFPKKIDSGIHSIRDRGSEFGTGSMTVPCKKISSFLQDRNIPAPSIVKVDVEGCSLEVLKSFEHYIHDVKIFHMESECEKYFKDQHLQDEVFQYLLDNGFSMTIYSTTPGSNQHDSVWVHNSLLAS